MLRVTGDIDLSAHAALHAALEDGLRAAHGHLVVDLSAVTFCSARGLCLIADAAAAAAAAGTDFTFSGLPARLKRIALLVWDDRVPRLFRTAADVVTATRAEQPQRN
jgi:anti-anti-sigma factor